MHLCLPVTQWQSWGLHMTWTKGDLGMFAVSYAPHLAYMNKQHHVGGQGKRNTSPVEVE